jgi:hypothetical protein
VLPITELPIPKSFSSFVLPSDNIFSGADHDRDMQLKVSWNMVRPNVFSVMPMIFFVISAKDTIFLMKSAGGFTISKQNPLWARG